VQLLLSGEVLVEAARSQVAWGVVYRDRGDRASARDHFGSAAAQFEAWGLLRDLDAVHRCQSPGMQS
jgi:hypothetical protein